MAFLSRYCRFFDVVEGRFFTVELVAEPVASPVARPVVGTDELGVFDEVFWPVLPHLDR